MSPQISPPSQSLTWPFHSFLGGAGIVAAPSAVALGWNARCLGPQSPGCNHFTGPLLVPLYRWEQSNLKGSNTFLEITFVVRARARVRTQIGQLRVLFWSQENAKRNIWYTKMNRRVKAVVPHREPLASLCGLPLPGAPLGPLALASSSHRLGWELSRFRGSVLWKLYSLSVIPKLLLELVRDRTAKLKEKWKFIPTAPLLWESMLRVC